MALSGYFYPRITYNSGASTINFTTAAQNILASELRVRGQNVSLGGYQETLSVRLEPRITVSFSVLSKDETTLLRTWFRDWASLGKQSVLTLDRLATCAGQYEYDVYNTFFTKAECLYNPFEPRRLVLARQYFVVGLVFRQGV